ncbi:aldehyde dehydrogenase family protein [Oceanicoccus sagamiensis]|uniref:Aldehyde dehydrogenase family protein n=1 Tax=Oceanicoccus sagamiensis TaxID=716816 RepID=A0A1X9NDV5_9GAMM|nr:aldehyde dehydrogenase family protein [Oceanicoccus sagamiensis]ARN76228.1 aldehyde dehydrogenase family protein [Oceanicoccus sagamiensis]
MRQYTNFYINGQWVAPHSGNTLDVINPATEAISGHIAMGSAADVDTAVAAAKAAFPSYANTSREQRLALLENILSIYNRRYDEIAQAISEEMGAPITIAMEDQAGTGTGHLETAIETLKTFEFEEPMGSTRIYKEPIGVCALITPWNWPINQVVCKVVPALATGCTIVLKPSEVAPYSSYLFAEVLAEAGVPAGVFNLVNGDGPTVGAAMSCHPDVDMVSFTGSTRAGAQVAKAAADTVKRVSQELGGKSANIILADADLEEAVTEGALGCFFNTGQSCDAPTRMLVPEQLHDKAVEIAVRAAQSVVTGDPSDKNTTMGPVVSQVQFDRIQSLIKQGIDEGSKLACGGPGKPDKLDKGYYVKPTIFSHVKNNSTIAQQEIFGPVLAILPYKDEAEAIEIANDSLYGLCGYVWGDEARAVAVASKMRTGMVLLNGDEGDYNAPFGGYKQSGNGREFGKFGFEEFLETKAIMGISGQ